MASDGHRGQGAGQSGGAGQGCYSVIASLAGPARFRPGLVGSRPKNTDTTHKRILSLCPDTGFSHSLTLPPSLAFTLPPSLPPFLAEARSLSLAPSLAPSILPPSLCLCLCLCLCLPPSLSPFSTPPAPLLVSSCLYPSLILLEVAQRAQM